MAGLWVKCNAEGRFEVEESLLKNVIITTCFRLPSQDYFHFKTVIMTHLYHEEIQFELILRFVIDNDTAF